MSADDEAAVTAMFGGNTGASTGVAETTDDHAESPPAFDAETFHMYETPDDNPVPSNVCTAGEMAVWTHVAPPSDEYATVYPVIGLPPSTTGVAHVARKVADPNTATDTRAGADGAANGMAETGADSALSPTVFLEETVKL